MAGPWFCSQWRSRPTCPFVWRVLPVWAPKMSPSHPGVRHQRLLCAFFSAASAEDGQSICVLKGFSYIAKGNNGKIKSGYSTNTKSTITCKLNPCSTFQCQEVWSPVKTEIFFSILLIIWGCKPHCAFHRIWKYTQSDSPGSCLA